MAWHHALLSLDTSISGGFVVHRLLIAGIAGILGFAGAAQVPSWGAELPTRYEAQLKAAKRVAFDQTVGLFGGCDSGTGSKCKKYGALKVSLGSLTHQPTEDPNEAWIRYRADIKVQNFSKMQLGTLPVIRCSNAQSDGGFYVGSVDTQFLAPRTQAQGQYYLGFPGRADGSGTMKPTDCKDAVIWIAPNPDFGLAAAKKAKKTPYAYIPLPPALLAALEASAVAGVAAQPAG